MKQDDQKPQDHEMVQQPPESEGEGSDRRAFVGKAALAGAAVALTGSASLAQGKRKKQVWAIPPPHKDGLYPDDDPGELRPLFEAAHHDATAAVERVLEKLVRADKTPQTLDVEKALAAEGLKLTSPGAKSKARKVKVPEAMVKKAKAAKARGWHGHYSSHHNATW